MKQTPEPPRWEGWRKALKQELGVLAFFAGFEAAITGVYALVQLGPGPGDFIDTWLRARWSTPWGAATAIFVHLGFEHYSGNALGLLAILALFVPADWSFRIASSRRTWPLLLAVVGSAVVGNLLSTWRVPAPLPGSSPLGASGIEYGLLGAALALAVLNSAHYVRLWGNQRRSGRPSLLVAWLAAMNLVFCLPWALLRSPAEFFAVASANGLVHIVGFFGGLLTGLCYGLLWFLEAWNS